MFGRSAMSGFRQTAIKIPWALGRAAAPAGVFGLYAITLIGALAAPAFALDARISQELAAYYDDGAICSTARVERLQFDPQRLTVYLRIEPRWATSLGKTQSSIRRRWFALHCPTTVFSPLRPLPDGDDVWIRGELPGHGEYTLSCREYHSARQHQLAAEDGSIRRKIDSLLQRLGVVE